MRNTLQRLEQFPLVCSVRLQTDLREVRLTRMHDATDNTDDTDTVVRNIWKDLLCATHCNG